MASGGAGYYGGDRYGQYGYGYGYGNEYSFSRQQQPTPSPSSFHLCLFLATASLLGAASLYSRCESAVEGLFDQLWVAVVLSPLVLLLGAQYWSATGRRWWSSSSSSLLVAPPVVSGEHPPWYEQQQQQQQRDGAGSSPWGVALALALVLLLVSYQPCFQDMWFPVISRRRRR